MIVPQPSRSLEIAWQAGGRERLLVITEHWAARMTYQRSGNLTLFNHLAFY
jgi:hypothetical protein